MRINLRHVLYYCRRLFNQKLELFPLVDSLRDTSVSRQEWGRAIAKAEKQSILPHRSIYVVRIQNLPYHAAKVGRSHIINKPPVCRVVKQYLKECIRCHVSSYLLCMLPSRCYIPYFVKYPVPLYCNGKYRVNFIIKDNSTFCPIIPYDDEPKWIRAQRVLIITLFNCLCVMSRLVCYLWRVKFIISWSTYLFH